MGKANLPYARSVQQLHPLPQNMLPDAGLVFDTLLKRKKVKALVVLTTSFIVDVYGLVREAPSRILKHDVFLCSACYSYVSLIAFFLFILTCANLPSKSVFRTSMTQESINETSSYVDLAPLYGNNADTLKDLREGGGWGRLFPDTFAEDRLLLLPPAVCALLVLFNRNHNVRYWSSINVSFVINFLSSTSQINCLKSMSVVTGRIQRITP